MDICFTSTCLRVFSPNGSDEMEELINGLVACLSLVNLVACFSGVFLGTIVGVLPGLGPAATMALCLPLTLSFSPATGIIVLAGIWFGAMYGGSTTSILMNLPGEAASVITCIDGYQLGRKGRAGAALAIVAVGSFVAGTIGIIGLQIFAPILGTVALYFGPAEYLSIVVVAFVLLSNLATESVRRSSIMLGLGLWLSSIGISPMDGVTRFTFGLTDMTLGISFVPIVMGLLGVAEILNISMETYIEPVLTKVRFKELYPNKEEMRRSIGPIVRGSFLGFFMGLIPSCGFISTFISYSLEMRLSKTPKAFGTGMVEGIAGPESANNSSVMGAMIPFLTLGLAFSAPSAILLAALRMHDVEPGPLLFLNNSDVFWTFVAAMYVGNIMLLILNLPLVGFFARIALVKPKILIPIVCTLCLVGSYAVRNSFFDVWVMIISGVIGYFFRKWKYPPIPLVIGMILGPITENNFRKSLKIFRDDWFQFFDRPLAVIFLSIALAVIAYKIFVYLKGRSAPSGVNDF